MTLEQLSWCASRVLRKPGIVGYEILPRIARDRKNGAARSRAHSSQLIGSSENDAAFRGITTFDAFAGFSGRVARDVANGGLRFVLHSFFALVGPAPMRPDEAPFAVQN